jgi:iron complex transport system substrate-binding protein
MRADARSEVAAPSYAEVGAHDPSARSRRWEVPRESRQVFRSGARAAGLRALAWACFYMLVATLATADTSAETPQRIISVDGALTEIVYALGADDRLVGVDTTSLYPAAAEALPKVGYKRALSAEGLLSLSPEVVLATDDAGPPEVLEQVTRAGVPIRTIPDTPTVAGLHRKIGAVAELLDAEAVAERLRERIDRRLGAVAAATAEAAHRPRVPFLLHVGSGNDLAAGRDTAADTVIRLAGGENVLHDAFEGYKPLSAEAALAAAPEVILVTERNLEGLGGKEGLLTRAALAATPAGHEGRVVSMDGPLLLAFGPRLGEAAAALARHLGTLEDDEAPADTQAAAEVAPAAP